MVLACVLATSQVAVAGLSEGQAAIVGGLIGAAIVSNQPQSQVYIQPQYAPQYQPYNGHRAVQGQFQYGTIPNYNQRPYGTSYGQPGPSLTVRTQNGSVVIID